MLSRVPEWPKAALSWNQPSSLQSHGQESPKKWRTGAMRYRELTSGLYLPCRVGRNALLSSGMAKQGNLVEGRAAAGTSGAAELWAGIPEDPLASSEKSLRALGLHLPAINARLSAPMSGGWAQVRPESSFTSRQVNMFANQPFLHPKKWQKSQNLWKVPKFKMQLRKKKSPENGVTLVCFRWPISL